MVELTFMIHHLFGKRIQDTPKLVLELIDTGNAYSFVVILYTIYACNKESPVVMTAVAKQVTEVRGWGLSQYRIFGSRGSGVHSPPEAVSNVGLMIP